LWRGLSVLPAGESQRFGVIESLPGGKTATGPLDPLSYLRAIEGSTIVMWSTEKTTQSDGSTKVSYVPKSVPGRELLVPGGSPTLKGVRSPKLRDKLDFLSLMIALFCGTASLPHILIRYYTVKDQASARK